LTFSLFADTEQLGGRMTINCTKCHQPQTVKVTEAQVSDWQKSGQHIQDYFPQLSADQRELFITGICGKCFDAMFSEEEE